MPIPIAASMIMNGLQKNEALTAAQAAQGSSTRDAVLGARSMRSAAQNEIQPAGRTGLQGIDALTTGANKRQMEIFRNVMAKYSQQPGGMV